MNVGELSNEQLEKAIIGRLKAGELDLLMREAGRRGLQLDLSYEEYRGAGQEKTVCIRTRIRFQPAIEACQD